MNKYKINYALIFTVLGVLCIFAFILALQFWKKNWLAGILITVLFISAYTYSILQLFIPQRVISVIINSTAIIINYRKTCVEIPYRDCKKLEHYKHGPLTERIWIYSKGYVYEIPFDIKGFRNMCGSIYQALSNINMEHIADEWFQKNFGNRD